MKRVEEASEASARSPCRAPGTVDVDQVHRAGGQRRQVERGLDGELALATGRVGVPQSRAGAASGSP